MEDAKAQFAQRLREAMAALGYDPKPAVLEREFNLRYWGKAMTLHGVRRWLRGETLPSQDKLLVLAEWLQVPPQQLRFGAEIETRVRERRDRWETALGYQDREMIEAYLRIPPPQRKALREVIMAVARAYPAEGGEGK
jgi:transcriptional regulator with XRE-family HTH domain